jgi:hypothetical protein
MTKKPGRRRAVREEFEGVELGDRRRAKRAAFIADRLAANPSASLPEAMRDRAASEALYRHLESAQVEADALLEPHVVKTVARVKAAGVAFAIADTTAVKFSGQAEREGLGPIHRSDQGFLAHVTLAVASDGSRRPLGVLGAETWARRGEAPTESDRWWRGMERAAKRAGPAALIHVADRESDIYDLMVKLSRANERFILRAAQDRALLPVSDDDAKRLFEAARGAPASYAVEVPLSARQPKRVTHRRKTFPARRSRTAHLSFASCSVTLRVPRTEPAKQVKSQSVNVVHVVELSPPAGEPAVEWILLTTEPVSTPDQIAFVVEGYRTRWMIEEFFKAVKTGCAFESRQLESLHTLTNLLAYVLVIAYAMLLLRTESRARDDDAADAVLTEKQLTLLRAVSRKLAAKPTVSEALYAVAALGGHLKNNGDPGWRTLSKGWQTLQAYETGYDLALASKM